RILASISITAWLAPPCSGPHSALMPAEIAPNRFTIDEPHSRTVEVEQFCSSSACRISSRSIAFSTTGSTWYGSHGVANMRWRKFPTYDSELLGYMNGCPIECLYA